MDDAVLSAWHVLTSPGEVSVVTVFAGVPEPGFVTDLDRSHGAGESAAWQRRRRSEDRAALVMAGRVPLHLDLPDVQFAAFRNPRLRELIAKTPDQFVAVLAGQPDIAAEPGELAAFIGSRLSLPALVYGPAGIGGHPDHSSLAQATIELATPGREIRLYADSPYYLARGLPDWLGGTPSPGASAYVERALAGLDLHGRRLARYVRELSEPEFRRKMTAVHRYETEFPSIWADLKRSPGGPESLRYEAYWTVGDASR